MIERILVPMNSDWFDKANTLFREYVYNFSFKISVAYRHVSNISKVRHHNVDKLMIEDTDSVYEI